MKTFPLILSLGLVCVFARSVTAQPEPIPTHNTLTEKEKADGWVLLFDGKTTEGWEIRARKGGVEVHEDALVVTTKAKEGVILGSRPTFHIYELRFEYRVGGKRKASIEFMPLQGSTKGKDDVWSEFIVRYTGGSKIHGEDKEPGVGTKKLGSLLIGDPLVALPQWIQIGPDTKLYLRNIKIRKLQLLNTPPAQEKSDFHDRIRRLPATLLASKKSDGEITDAMFLALLIRLPTDDEKARMAKMFATHGKRENAVEELMWSLVNTKEFAALHGLPDFAAPPAGQETVPTLLGPKAFRHGDTIEITGVWATSPRLEPGDSVTVRGGVRLASHDQAQLILGLTQTAGVGRQKLASSQVVQVKRGQGKFELMVKIKHPGVLHLTLYDGKGRPVGGVYFGTAEQMKQIEGWSLDYYLGDAPADKAQPKKTGKAKPKLPEEQRNQIALLEVPQKRVEQGERMPGNLEFHRTTVSVRGTLLKTPDLNSYSPRTGLPQSHHWRLEARTEAGNLVLPLQISDKKLLGIADTYAGKEVVLTGSTVLLRRLMQRYEGPPFLAVEVVALRLPNK